MSDALTLLRTSTPERLYRFAELVAADPDLRLEPAAAAVGQPGKGPEMMRDPRTLKVFAAMVQELRDTHKEIRSQTVQMLAQLAVYDPAEAFTLDGRPKNIHDIPPLARAALKGYKVKGDGSVEIQWIDRLRVLELLMAHFGDIDHGGRMAEGGMAQVVFRGRGER